MKYALVTCCCFVLAAFVKAENRAFAFFIIGIVTIVLMVVDKSK